MQTSQLFRERQQESLSCLTELRMKHLMKTGLWNLCKRMQLVIAFLLPRAHVQIQEKSKNGAARAGQGLRWAWVGRSKGCRPSQRARGLLFLITPPPRSLFRLTFDWSHLTVFRGRRVEMGKLGHLHKVTESPLPSMNKQMKSIFV